MKDGKYAIYKGKEYTSGDIICDVNLPPDTPLEVSITGEQLEWANSAGGKSQYGIKDVETSEDWFVNKRSLK